VSNAFPDSATVGLWAREVHWEACDARDIQRMPTSSSLKIVSVNFLFYTATLTFFLQYMQRGPQIRGEFKTKARPLVEGFFGFWPGSSQSHINRNRQRALNLLRLDAFLYKVFASICIY
jgi:hypothetical protein